MSWAQAFDDRADTHWFSRDGQFLSGRTDAHVWLEYCLPAQQGTVALARYTLTAASGSPSRDPMDFVLYGVRAPHVRTSLIQSCVLHDRRCIAFTQARSPRVCAVWGGHPTAVQNVIGNNLNYALAAA